MAIKSLTVENVAIAPVDIEHIALKPSSARFLYDLSSHKRARQALAISLKLRQPGFNMFVIGDEGSSRLTSTVDFIQESVKGQSAGYDWVYVSDFKNKNKALPLKFQAGKALHFKKQIKTEIENIHHNLERVLLSPDFLATLKAETDYVESDLQKRLSGLKSFALSKGLDLRRLNDGSIEIVDYVTPTAAGLGETSDQNLPQNEDPEKESAREKLYQELQELTVYAQEAGTLLYERIEKIKKSMARKTIASCFKRLKTSYEEETDTYEWIKSMRTDILSHLDLFVDFSEQKSVSRFDHRYSVNVLVTQSILNASPLIVESNPTYENLFGAIQYRNTASGMETDFTLAQAGSLHKANGGLLVVRAEVLARYPESWFALKQALRTEELKMNDQQKHGLLVESPTLAPIPLDVQIVLVGDPKWYYNFFYNDADFKSFFKVKADIEPYFSMNADDLKLYASFLQEQSLKRAGYLCEKNALGYLVGYSTRLSGNRLKVSTQCDRLVDLLVEASFFTKQTRKRRIHLSHIMDAIQARDYRNDRLKDQMHEHYHEGIMIICTQGRRVGQINALTVQSIGADSFGAPSRITARTYMGRRGILNIEHVVALGGPIQHKGVLGLEGYLRGTFSQEFPVSFSCSLTFEQSYGGVEGDSASMAELCAILSSLSEIPIRQDLAITGSINQFGEVQAIGGVNEKIEGFFHICKHKGLTGTQGVIIPESNRQSVALNPEVSAAIAAGQFHLWSIESIGDAVQLLMGNDAGETSFKENVDSVFGKAYAKLKFFDESLSFKKSG